MSIAKIILEKKHERKEINKESNININSFIFYKFLKKNLPPKKKNL